ncbi:MAG: hypothetical protein JWQ35_332, partial [Bacteriovoracaceae bacterium]|nr:hypothetical protein [Bacteriovoracaceae bacterium]
MSIRRATCTNILIVSITLYYGNTFAQGIRPPDVTRPTLQGFTSIDEKIVPADLSNEQVESIELLTKLRDDEYFSAVDENQVTSFDKDLSRPCPRGGELSVKSTDAYENQRRADQETSLYRGWGEGSASAQNCKLVKERKWISKKVNGSEKWEQEPITPNHLYSVNGSIDVISKFESTVHRSGGAQKPRRQNAKAASFEMIVNDTINGKTTAEVPDQNGKPSVHTIEFKNLGMAYKVSDKDYKEYREIEADPLGENSRKQGLL